ncbi:SPOR domain-containing protein [Guyparkeria halophila]|uniref:SPOR domain-containing protein n=1 Tax=Guyparkeria halophila TaxID=47960 RepID=A0ABZ0YXF9_9GAMM|nr:SPOR domain-containing protein [Guyparkeria halophila]WQH16857.1 SPOR domain-containing protein [Guyparkeria halophila]
MTEATEHALEQAERIVQYAKYSDRFMVVEGESAAERRAFVKLIGQKLPRQVRPAVLRADSGNGSAALIDQLSTMLHLSAGIETIDQLISAATATLEGQERLLIVVENADHWLASDAADALFDLITQSHELARERILFLLVGAAGLCEQAETAQPLAGLVADLHCAQLLGSTQAAAAAPAAAAGTPDSAAAAATTTSSAPPTDNQPSRPAPASRPLWASPTLLIAAVISVAVVAIGVFALLGRSEAPTPSTTEKAIALNESSEQSAARASADAQGAEEQTANEGADSETPSGTDIASEKAADTEAKTAAPVDHGLPPHVPFPEESTGESSAPATADAAASDSNATESTDGSETSSSDATGQEADAATTPVTEEARGTAASTPPADVDNAWFRDQPRARAAIQLAAFGNLDGAESMIERFATDAQPRDQWRIYTQAINGKILYTVTFGDFASAERAEHAIDSLPTALRDLKPYPRSIGAIQDRLIDATD